MEQENIDFVICKLCGYKKQHIILHLKNKHNLTVKEYLQKFLDTKVVADKINKKISKTKESTKEKRSKEAKEAFRTGKRKIASMLGRGMGGARYDLDNQYFRCMWEANFARLLRYKNIKYEYEKKIALYDKNNEFKYTYAVDFYLPDFDSYIEIKGKWEDIALEKVKLFKEQYPNKKFVVIDYNRYKIIESSFKWIIPLWETPKGNNIRRTPELYKFNIIKIHIEKNNVKCPICKLNFNKINTHLISQKDQVHKDYYNQQIQFAKDLFYMDINKNYNISEYNNCIFNYRQLKEIWRSNNLFKRSRRRI